ncbi:prolyl oligopeptidase family serine peptidase [Pseudomonas benzenivorans]|uniref:Prolyl oligopeptidase family serine peptidase n=1 Tax=Pseudomonas benzenivorans TaxID=556533 RepID=A0ABZ0Q033_9PSED|nr:prolyl oligopeptidase family serine peptidase [Pseudomonas benzenivorans]WPC06561.1 prolyl oligopeptidase family serine peptidase [Pseudomonas benzenivorans]
MSGQRVAPFGFWDSAWSSDQAAAAGRDFAELRAGLGGLVWLQYDPADGRSTLWYWTSAALRCLTPADLSVRSRVYEYGGGAFCLTEQGVAFVGEADQQLYYQPLDAAPERLSNRPHCRYGDLHYDARGSALLAVEEAREAGQVLHRLVAIALADGARRVLVEGRDFYAAPTLSADGRRLAWIEWDRPRQPWLATRLCVAERSADGSWRPPRVVAGQGNDESLQQPAFDDRGRLLVLGDRHGYWQPWRETAEGRLAPLPCAAADHAAAPWQLGACTYLALAGEGLLLSWFEDGCACLVERAADGRGERRLAPDYSRFRQLTADTTHFYLIAAAPTRCSAVLAIERASGQCRVLAGGAAPLAQSEVSRPRPLSFTSGGEACHAFFYPPHNGACHGPDGEQPPLLVFLHGGPTSACYPAFDPRIQFWTQRGFAVADLNYRGSSGYGRAYRMALHERWGELEVVDAGALLEHLAGLGLIDPARAFIRGASAGGYTALCALAGGLTFRGGASLYGVSDPLALRRVTHKFEADYLDWLIGDPQRDARRYAARTPLLHADKIEAPVIFFQGGQDAVVLPSQTETMVEALRGRGLAVDYHFYPEEGHGFRQARNQAHALEQEWRFYQRLLG